MRMFMAYRFLMGSRGKIIFPLSGVIISTMALIMTLSLGEGGKRIIEKDLGAIGKNRILVGGDNLGSKDLDIVERLPFVEYAMFPQERIVENGNIFMGYSKKALKVLGINYLRENEVVLDKSQNGNKELGEVIYLQTGRDKRQFKIKGFYQEESPLETMKVGKRVVLGRESFGRIFGRKNYRSLVISFPQDEDGVEYIPLVLRELNRSRFSYDKVSILETPDVYKKVERIKSFVNRSLFILSFISLIVGGMGVFNLIGTSVKNRTSSIGIMRTMGMDKKTIKDIFLIEGLMVIVAGGLLGLILGLISSKVVGLILKIPPYFSVTYILGALIISMGVSLIFGVFPAKKAGNENIVESLKN